MAGCTRSYSTAGSSAIGCPGFQSSKSRSRVSSIVLLNTAHTNLDEGWKNIYQLMERIQRGVETPKKIESRSRRQSASHGPPRPDPTIQPVVTEKSAHSEWGEPLELIPAGDDCSRKTDQRPKPERGGESNLRARTPS
jgi:hypothetical protein